ncbi:SLATT domain-containing protein [Kitasatospora camelliae]|uniref:SLATT domain-containing protein n=1 Tax=Kitasatospora camelliae TaxID=3156397 RepID=A0AAU8JYG4_9ACTN
MEPGLGIDDHRETRETAERRLAFIELEVRQQLVGRRRRRDWDRRRAFGLQIAAIALSATVTVLLGLKVAEPLDRWLANTALGLGALTTVLAAWGSFYSHRTLWIQRAETVHRLGMLERRLAYHRTGLGAEPPDPAEVDAFFAEYEELVQNDHESWVRIRQIEGLGPSAGAIGA